MAKQTRQKRGTKKVATKVNSGNFKVTKYTDKEGKKILAYCATGVIIAIVMIILSKCEPKEDITNLECYCECATAPIKSKERFKDFHPTQLAHAQKNGLEAPIKDRAEFESKIEELVDNDILVEIEPTRYYTIRPLTHSFPYLIPEAEDLLELIGHKFQYNLKEAGLPKYRFEISSLLRTVEFQSDLMHLNINATPNKSTHYYGTTFDIAYNKYSYRGKSEENHKAEEILVATLRELRKNCRLLIVRERSNKCFHITVVCRKTEE